ncbi:hypothetical protein BGX21_007337, partial [Mortierella sp. AD011]
MKVKSDGTSAVMGLCEGEGEGKEEEEEEYKKTVVDKALLSEDAWTRATEEVNAADPYNHERLFTMEPSPMDDAEDDHGGVHDATRDMGDEPLIR